MAKPERTNRFSPRKVSLAEKLAFHSEPQPNGCVLWNAYKIHSGYGMFSFNGKRLTAHRAAWIAHRGPIPDGLFVCHRCDVPACINPDHLWLGTCADNLADMVAKKRQAKQDGERGPNAKLTNEQAEAIRNMAGSHSTIAARFGVSPSAIGFIKIGKTYRHGQ